MFRGSLIIIGFFITSWAFANGHRSIPVDLRNTAAPEFVLADLTGHNSIDLKDYLGKVVYVDFWASSCFACRLSFPFLNKLKATYGAQGFDIIAVNIDKQKQDALDFLAKYPLDYAVAWDPSGQLANDYHVQALPTGFMLDTQGQIRLVHLGFSSRHEGFLIAHVEKLLAEQLK